ncbi:MAG: ParB N-terminal domain-containing protein [Rhodobacteraceae bacterium]|nr:ParB N-terminal domain-containing protein [Paracoccaceae bacterium]
MVKRKRLTPAQTDYLDTKAPVLETKSMSLPGARAPIAQVAGDASATAALQELAGEVKRAKDEGRMIQALPLDAINVSYLSRDRIAAEGDDLQELQASIRARGQQMPIEVVALEGGRHGLISGWRRLTALQRLHAETGEAGFATVLSILRQPETASDAYVAMVEENEIRLGLSYYERARVAAKAVEQGVYPTEKAALLALYSTASRAKRSKIRSFLALYHATDDLLRFASAIPERLGLSLVKALDSDPGNRTLLREELDRADVRSPEAEAKLLQEALKRMTPEQSRNPGSEADWNPELRAASRPIPSGSEKVVTGITMAYSGRSLSLKGPRVTDDLRVKLAYWLKSQLGG